MIFCKIRPWKLALVTATALASSFCQAQIKVTQTKIERTLEGELRLVPDPANQWDCLHLMIDDASIRGFVGVSKDDVSPLHEFAKQVRVEEKQVMTLARESGLNVSEAVLQYRADVAAEVYNELLLPSQQVLLKKLIYRLEIQRMGLGESITSGRLSQAVGVHDNQKDGLMRAAGRIEKELHEKIRALRQEAEDELFLHLTPDQRKLAQDLTSDTEEYVEPTRYQSKYALLKEALEQGHDPFAIRKSNPPDSK